MEEQNLLDEISLREIFEVLVKWRVMIVVLTITAVISSGFFTKYFITPIYRSNAVLMVTHADTQTVVRSENDLEDVVGQVSQIGRAHV